MLFSELNLDKNLLRGIEEAGYSTCTPIQQETFTHTLTGRDILAQSQTGTGKTAAFLISLYQQMLSDDQRPSDKALIIAPTRELVNQVEEEARLLGLYLPFATGAFYGGVGYHKQEQLLKDGVDIFVATPGRLLDFVQKGYIDLHSMGYLVIDEADRLFDMGFLPDVRRILRRMRPPAQRQTMLFSATLCYAARHLASEHMNNPAEVEIASQVMTVDKVDQELYHVGHVEKLRLLLGLLKREAPTNCMIFTNMKSTAERLAQRLEMNGYRCEYLTGDLPQNRRQRTVDQFKNGEFPVLVATDVAARGLHIDELSLVVNFDLPEDSEVYVHRIGRTARAGKSGKAISLACEESVEALPAIQKLIGMRIPVVHADEELYLEDVSKGKSTARRSGTRDGNRRGSGGRDRRPERRDGSSSSTRDKERRPRRTPHTTAPSENRHESSSQTSRRHRSGPSGSRSSSPVEAKQNQPRSEQPAQQHQAKQKPRSLFRKIVGIFKR